jgi:hypothetical protein
MPRMRSDSDVDLWPAEHAAKRLHDERRLVLFDPVFAKGIP